MAKKDVKKMRRDAVMHYKANGGNMKQAMIDAGYSESYAVSHSEYLSRIVGQEIQEAQKEINSPKIKTIQEIQEWWSANIDDPNVDKKDQIKCSELLAKSQGGFVENVNVNAKPVNPLAGLSTAELKKLVADD